MLTKTMTQRRPRPTGVCERHCRGRGSPPRQGHSGRRRMRWPRTKTYVEGGISNACESIKNATDKRSSIFYVHPHLLRSHKTVHKYMYMHTSTHKDTQKKQRKQDKTMTRAHPLPRASPAARPRPAAAPWPSGAAAQPARASAGRSRRRARAPRAAPPPAGSEGGGLVTVFIYRLIAYMFICMLVAYMFICMPIVYMFINAAVPVPPVLISISSNIAVINILTITIINTISITSIMIFTYIII